MSNGKTTLTIQSGAIDSADWQNTTSHGGKEYAYRFDGATAKDNDHKGKGKFKSVLGFPPGKHPKKDYEVELVSDDPNKDRFEIVDVQVHYGGNQFSGKKIDKGKAKLDNANSRYQQAFYCIVVKDTSSNGDLIDCDPMISNDPR